MKWDSDADQVLLLKILETSNVIVDVKAISESWPTEKNDDKGKAPTPRAITERLVKIRAMTKAKGSGHFTVSSANKNGTVKNRAPVTPQKPRAKALVAAGNDSVVDGQASVSTTPGGSAGKRKRPMVKIEAKDDYETEGEDESPTKKIRDLQIVHENAESYQEDEYDKYAA